MCPTLGARPPRGRRMSPNRPPPFPTVSAHRPPSTDHPPASRARSYIFLSMTRILLPLLLLVFSPLLGRAASSSDAVRALAHIVTFGPAGDTLAHAEGFFIDAAGTLVAPYAPFRGATRALITDSRRRQGRVLRIAGADETLDLLRATTDLPRRADEFLPLTAQGYPAGVALTLVSPTPAPRGTLIPTMVLTAEALRSHRYYTLTADNGRAFAGLPLLAPEGSPAPVAAIAQFNYAPAPGLCAISASAVDSLRITAVSALSSDLAALRLPTLLPADEGEAYTYLYMLLRSRRDSACVATALTDFLSAHPGRSDVLRDAARFYAARADYRRSDSLLSRAEQQSESSAERSQACETRAALIFDARNGADSLRLPAAWSLPVALRALDRADSLSPRPSVWLLRGILLYGAHRDAEALRAFERVNRSAEASLRSYFFAAQALARSGGSDSAVVALLDSAVARSPQPLTADAAAPLAWRAVYAERMGNARRAALDLVDYERLVPAAELRAPFFLRRAALAERARLYRRAVDDYTTAAARADTRELRLEALTLKALLCVHLSAGDEALAAAEELSRLAPDTPDALKLLGLSHQLLGHRTLARRYLSQAAAKGDANAAELLRKVK